MNIDQVLGVLDSVRRCGDGWSARCPVPDHDDTHNSLTIANGHTADVVVKCQKSCSQEQVLAEIRRRLGEGTPPAKATPLPPRRVVGTKTYEILDTTGKLVALQKRIDYDDGKKSTPWLHPDGRPSKNSEIKPATLPLYGSEKVAAWHPDAPIVLTEGPTACDALTSHGYCALATMTGAGDGKRPGDAALEVLRGKDNILWQDHDEVGREHMALIARALDGMAKRIRIFEWGDREGDDAADFFQRGGTESQLDSLLAEALEWKPAAAPYTMPHTQTTPQTQTQTESTPPPPSSGQAPAERQHDGQDNEPRIWTAGELLKADLPRPQGLIEGRILCPGSVTMTAGVEGVGKTFLKILQVYSTATGSPFASLKTRAARGFFISEEMDAGEIKDRLHQLFTAREEEELRDLVRFVFRAGLLLDTEKGLTRLRRLIERAGSPEYVPIDALSDVHTSDENSNRDMGRLLRRVRAVAQDTGAVIDFNHHFAKPDAFRSGADRIRGASAIKATCADLMTITIGRKGVRTVRFPKVRHGKPPKPFSFTIDGDGDEGPVTIAFGDAKPERDDRLVKAAGLVTGEMKTGAILEAIKAGLGVADTVADDLLRAAVGDGLLRKVSHGVYAPPKPKEPAP